MSDVRLTTMRGFQIHGLWLMVEAGPPFIWIPRLGRTAFATSYETWFSGLSFGLGWLIVTIGREARQQPPTEDS